jgi:hypothetical protein
MKTYVIVAIVMLIILCTCLPQPQAPIQGTWKLLISRSLGDDSAPPRPFSSHWRSIKIIGKNHFATIWQDTTSTGFWSNGYNGGEYDFKDNQYTEHYQFFSEKGILGAKATFSVKRERNILILSFQRKNKKGELTGMYEEWKRLE